MNIRLRNNFRREFQHTVLIGILFFLPLVGFGQQFTKIPVIERSGSYGYSWGIYWGDYDNDGYDDLYITRGYYNSGINNSCFHNNGDGTFTEIPAIAIGNDGRSSAGASWGDFNNDGNLDLFVANTHGQNNLIFQNTGNTSFIISECHDYESSNVVSWADYDNDGFLDLYVTNDESKSGRPNILYRNIKGVLTRIYANEIVKDIMPSHCAGWADIDNDGDIDLFVAESYNLDNNLYVNNGEGRFSEIRASSIVGDRGWSRGCSWADYDNDGDLDLFIANSNQNNCLYKNNGDHTFKKITKGCIVNDGGWSFGSSWGDFDNDGDLDLIVTNAVLSGSNPSRNFLYWNIGNDQFQRSLSGDIVTDIALCDGVACADYDNDGDLDIAIARESGNTQNVFYRNNGNTNHWITIRLTGTSSNRSAIGCKVRLCSIINGEKVWQLREISGQTGYCGQNSLRAHFGLGNSVSIDTIIVQWTSGLRDTITNVLPDQLLNLTESQTTVGVDQNIHNHLKEVRKLQLLQNFPNPFNPITAIRYRLEKRSKVRLKICDNLGKVIKIFVNSCQNAGDYEYIFDGRKVASGLYFCFLETEQSRKVIKLVLVR